MVEAGNGHQPEQMLKQASKAPRTPKYEKASYYQEQPWAQKACETYTVKIISLKLGARRF